MENLSREDSTLGTGYAAYMLSTQAIPTVTMSTESLVQINK